MTKEIQTGKFYDNSFSMHTSRKATFFFIGGEMIVEKIAYNPIANNDGIMKDPYSSQSVAIIKKFLEDSGFGWAIQAPY